MPRQKRVLDYSKCVFCRRDKQKCAPAQRRWPQQRCSRCQEKNLVCSKPQRAHEDGSHSSLLLLSIHCLLMMALEELKSLGEEIEIINADDPQWRIRAARLDRAASEYKDLARKLGEKLHGMICASPVYLSLLAPVFDTDCSQSNMTWAPDQNSISETERSLRKIKDLEDLGHDGWAHVVHIRRFLKHPELVESEHGQFIACRLRFLNQLDTALDKEGLGDIVAPSSFSGSQGYLPKDLLKAPSLFEHVTQVGRKDWLNRTPSHLAYDAGRRGQWHEDHIAEQDVLGRTALHLACAHGDDILVRRLVRNETLRKARTITGLTPLHIATTHCSKSPKPLAAFVDCLHIKDLVEALVQKDCLGRIPLTYGLGCKLKNFLHELHWYTLYTHYFDEDIDFDDRDNFGNTPVSFSVRYKFHDLVDILVGLNYMADVPDTLGRTPFWYAVQASDLTSMVILANLVNVDHMDHENCTPFAEAARQCSFESMKFLLDLNLESNELRVNPHSVDKQRNTPFSHVAAAGNLDCKELLVNHRSFREDTGRHYWPIIQQHREVQHFHRRQEVKHTLKLRSAFIWAIAETEPKKI